MKEQLEKILQNATKELEGISDLKAWRICASAFSAKRAS